MAPYNWSLIVLLFGILLLGFPNGGKPEAPSEETKTSSVKECRVHIEKALEQYWDHKEPVKSENPLDQTKNIVNSLNADDKNDDDILEQNDIQNSDDDEDEEEEAEEDDDDDDENGMSDDQEEKNATEDESEKLDDDSDEDNENENNANEDESETLEDDSDEDDENEDDENEDDDDEQDNDNGKFETIRADVSKTTTSENEKDADKNSESNADDEEENDEEEVDEEENDDKDDDEEEDPTTDQNNLKSSYDKMPSDQREDSQHAEKNKEIGSMQQDEEDEKDDDDEEEDEDEDEHEDDDDDDGIEGEEDEEEDEETYTKAAVKESGGRDKLEKDEESDKVIGEADSGTAGVVSKLPVEKPSIEQSQAKTVQEETVNITTTTKEEIETKQDEVDDQESILEEDENDEPIENIYEDDEDESSSTLTFRSRDHIDVILGLDEIGTEYEKEEEKLAQNIFKDIKKIELTSIKPIEMLYKYTDSTTRVLGDAEIFNKPMLLFLGPWSSGKTTIINYLLGLERTPATLKTGTGITDVDFSLVTYGDQKQMISGTELAVDWRYAGVQKFGQGFLDHFRSISVPSTLLKKVTIVDTPGILENRKNTERGYSFNDAFQWFIDRADAIYVVLDPTKVDIGSELGSVIDQLKGRDVRFILNKADTIRRSDLMRVVGQLFWNLSPLMSSSEAPIIYATSLTSKPFHPSAPARFLADQEKNFLYDMKETLDKRVENRILYARRHAVRVRNHAKMVDCFLATYYYHKSIFSNKKSIAKLITENPKDYNIFEGLSSMTNISRYDIPDPKTYKDFFKQHPLYDFKPLASTCSYFRGCPMDKLDAAIGQEIPELFSKYKKAKSSSGSEKQEGR